MKLKQLSILAFLVVVNACNADGHKEASIRYLEKRGYVLKPNGYGVLSSIMVKNRNIEKKDLESICDIGTVKSIFFQSSHLEKGAVRGLEECDKLEYIRYEPLQIVDKDRKQLHYGELSTVSLADIPDFDRIPHLIREKETKWQEIETGGLTFKGNAYGDDLLAALGKLRRVRIISVNGIMPDSQGESGNRMTCGGITDDGIRRFVEARTEGVDLILSFMYQSKLTDKAFEHLLDLKGLKYVAFGPRTAIKLGITKEGVGKFVKAYQVKYGYRPMVVTDY